MALMPVGDSPQVPLPSVVGAENLCQLAGCSADRWLLGARCLPRRGTIFGLWG
jgi:hypothetical protein